ncbi:acid protease [Gloeophyllum trabeum ATCC 11539]|uniref:Acid protease n=1 Tax=Gloeophyllum trabeum (strain ATCC 11539 / FP-39264 / Madison 617) TaxID=670483 RepID=S7QKX6_GLOTA|nr:acid protease [Gloeophyllum trabeum ATCC 11539]EPQ59943.1 acid protease [Gloeophyllum trabeum ATCC 11539]
MSPLLFVLAVSIAVIAPATSASVRGPKSLVSLPIARRVAVTGIANILKSNQARAAQLRSGTLGGRNKDVCKRDGVDTLTVDTGSSNTWAGVGTAYKRTSRTKLAGNLVSMICYVSFAFVGTEVTDTVSLGNNLTINNQSIGDAYSTQGFTGTDGILGIGPTNLTEGMLFPALTSIVPTFTDNPFSQGVISAHEANATNGELTFRGTHSSKYNERLNYVPLTTSAPANQYRGIDQSVAYGNTTILSQTAGMLDTGTTLILLATGNSHEQRYGNRRLMPEPLSDALNAHTNATGATYDETTGLYTLTASQYASLESLYFNINGIGRTADNIYLIVGDMGSTSGTGLGFINGFAFLERYYTVFDTAGQRIGLATTYTSAEIN